MRRAAKSKFFYIFGAALIIILGVYFFSNYSKTQTTTAVKEQAPALAQRNSDETLPQTKESTEEQPKKVVPKPAEETRFSDESDVVQDQDILVVEISYDGKIFTPSLTTIKSGDVVFFKNESDKAFWPAVGPHPLHNTYPGFDAKKPIPPGETFQFTFTKKGKWSYHDHLNEDVVGMVEVK